MLIAAAVEWRLGVNAERVSLEGVAAPLSLIENDALRPRDPPSDR
jgi:hypothetical protein